MPKFRSLFVGLPLVDGDQDRFVGEFRARLILASEGGLRKPDQVDGPTRKPTNIDLFEMRWCFYYGNDELIHVRMYHVEPPRLGSLVVALHLHVKDVTPGIDVEHAQDEEIKIAADRYWDGKSDTWGRFDD